MLIFIEKLTYCYDSNPLPAPNDLFSCRIPVIWWTVKLTPIRGNPTGILWVMRFLWDSEKMSASNYYPQSRAAFLDENKQRQRKCHDVTNSSFLMTKHPPGNWSTFTALFQHYSANSSVHSSLYNQNQNYQCFYRYIYSKTRDLENTNYRSLLDKLSH